MSDRRGAGPGHPSSMTRRLRSFLADAAMTLCAIAIAAAIPLAQWGCNSDNPGAKKASPASSSSTPAAASAPSTPQGGATAMGAPGGTATPLPPPSNPVSTAKVPVEKPAPPTAPPISSLMVNTATVVTVELDLGSPPLTVASAMGTAIERRHEPDDHVGRTFAVLDAYGGPTPDGKKLHISMHVSGEKPGLGSLVDVRTGQVLWQAAVLASSDAKPAPRDLTIIINDGTGKQHMVDGSTNPATIMEATIREGGVPMREFWPDGVERELSFIYSACGCPVKARVKRTGNTTVRIDDGHVMFPDDPVALQVIRRLMGWL